MADLKYKKYIIEDYVPRQEEINKTAADPERSTRLSQIVRSGDDILKGALSMGFVWALHTSSQEEELPAHTHDYNEVLGWIGTDWEHPHDLGAEIEFWLEDEKYILTHSCIIFIPKGMKHGPLKDLRIDRPVIHFGVTTNEDYTPGE